jgi:tRNA (adenine57-N1/adenine58-N1)-methyltransferase
LLPSESSSSSVAAIHDEHSDSTPSETIKEGDRVLLYLDERRTWLVRVGQQNKDFHTHAGIIDLSRIIDKKFGDSLDTTLGRSIFLLRPVTLDYIMKSERRTQIVYPKDFAYISARSGLRCGCRVLECGTGSGALTSYFASVVAPHGLIHTFEERQEFLESAKRNVEKAGLARYVRFENSNLSFVGVSEAAPHVPEETYDLAMLDTGDPWNLLGIAHRALKGSGFVFCICPTTNQLETVVACMQDRFVDIESVEILLRRMEARVGKTRPSMRMIGHTCYLASGRKVAAVVKAPIV